MKYRCFCFLIISMLVTATEMSASKTYIGPKPVDLGLSVLWGDQNIIDTHYSTVYYYWGGGNGITQIGTEEEYPDNICGTKYDVATQLYGDGWRMPTADEFRELCEKCSATCNSQGVTFTAPNGNSIMLPSVGYRQADMPANDYTYYWTGTVGNPGLWNPSFIVKSTDPAIPDQHFRRYAPDAFVFNSAGIKDKDKICNYLFSDEYQCAIRPVKDKTETATAYSVSNNGMLTFYYDNSKDSRSGIKYDVESSFQERPSWAKDSLNIKTVTFDPSFADFSPTSTAFWFSGFNELTSVSGLSNLNTSNVTNMRSMFSGCASLESIDVSSLDTKNVTAMAFMFFECSSLKSIDVTHFNTANCTTMRQMFMRCSALNTLELRSFNTAKVTDMHAMFYECLALRTLNIGTFTTDNVTDMYAMFYKCGALTELDVSGFNTSKVTNMGWMFSKCTGVKKLYLTGFRTDNVTNVKYMFSDCVSLTTIYVNADWNTEKVTDGINMFGSCASLVGGAGTRYTANNSNHGYARLDNGASRPGYFTSLASTAFPSGTKAYAVRNNKTLTFYYDDKISSRSGTKYLIENDYNEANMPRWVLDYNRRTLTKAVFDASFARYRPTCTAFWFFDCPALTSIEGISNLNTSQVTSMAQMFRYCEVLNNLDLRSFDTSNVTDMQCMFCYCFKLSNLNISNFNTAKVTNMSHMFHNCPAESIDVSGFDTHNVTDMSIMFAGCYNLKTLDLKNFNTEKVTDMSWMFLSCEQTNEMDVTSFNTSNVESMYGMFAQCYQLKELNLKSFNTSKVSNIGLMFHLDNNLKTIYAKRNLWSNENVVDNSPVFTNCNSLVGGCGTKFDKGHVDKDYAIIDEGESKPGYLTDVYCAYAVYKDGTLTFYYDDKMQEREGKSYLVAQTLFETAGNVVSIAQYWIWVHENDILHAQFDQSFAEYHIDKYHLRLFDGLSYMKDITGLEYFNIDNTTELYDLFYGCSSLKSLDLSSFNTAHIKYMNRMFKGCSSLRTIYVGNGWSTANLNESGGNQMFESCFQLVGGQGTRYDANQTDDVYAHIDGGLSDPGYLTYKSSEPATGLPETNKKEKGKLSEQLADPVYNLSGQRLLSPLKGINIIRGKKVVIK